MTLDSRSLLDSYEQLYQFFCEYISENKQNQIEKVLSNRTRYLTVVLENLHQAQNASAVLRTCEALGIQQVYTIEDRNPLRVKKLVAQGADKWLDLTRYNKRHADNIAQCITDLRQAGYRIVATTPTAKATPLFELSIDSRLALFFGAEDLGLSDRVLSEADECVRIPMYGFTKSYNISVSAAITLFYLLNRIRSSSVDWRLSEEEKWELRIRWARRILPRAHLLEQRFAQQMRQK